MSIAGTKFVDFKVTLIHAVCVTITQDSQGTYKATLRRVSLTIVAVEKQQALNSMCVCVCVCVFVCVCVCVCVYSCLSYPVCKTHAPYCTVTCGLSACNILFHINP